MVDNVEQWLKMSKTDKVYDSFVDRFRDARRVSISTMNDEIFKSQKFIYECRQHEVITQEEYEDLYKRFKDCLE